MGRERRGRRPRDRGCAVAQTWAVKRLGEALENLRYDDGPRSLTRVVARYRLFQVARTGEPAARRLAVATLALLKAKGTLAALTDEPGEVAALARDRLTER